MMNYGLSREQILGLPAAASPIAGLLAQPQDAPAAPFVWGQGGQALSPDDIARRRQMAEAQAAAGMDYSPVGSWTQGLARVAQGLVGGLEERKLDKAAAANEAQSQDIIAKLLAPGGGTGNAPLAALANPNLGAGAKSIAELLYKQNNPAPRAPGADEELLLAQGLVPGTPEYQAAAKALFDRKSDPIVTVSTPIGIYSGPQSQLGQFMGGGGQPSGAPGMGSPAAPPPAAVKALLGGEGTDAQFDQLFGQGAAARARGSTGGPMPSASGTFR